MRTHSANGVDLQLISYNEPLNQLVNPEFQRKVSFQNFVDSRAWNEVPGAERAKLAEAIVRDSLQDLELGVVDKDPSRGNVLVSNQKQNLIRIDVAQPLRLKTKELTILKDLVLLLNESETRPSESLLQFVKANISVLFDISDKKALTPQPLTSLKNVNWSSNDDVLSRLLVLSEAIESSSNQEVTFSLQANVAAFFEFLLRIESWKEYLPPKTYDDILKQFFNRHKGSVEKSKLFIKSVLKGFSQKATFSSEACLKALKGR